MPIQMTMVNNGSNFGIVARIYPHEKKQPKLITIKASYIGYQIEIHNINSTAIFVNHLAIPEENLDHAIEYILSNGIIKGSYDIFTENRGRI